MKTGPKNLITDVSGLYVGNSSDENLKSGVTVLSADQPFTASVDVRGGAPGTRETDLLAPDKLVQSIDAITLSGGSAFGLDAAAGVMDKLHENGRGFEVASVRVPLVSSAIIFDLLNGGDKQWSRNPYNNLGRHAYDALSEQFALGTAGAGVGATTADLKGGLGSASVVLPDGTTIGALVVVNARGSVVTPGSGHFWAAPFEVDGEYGNYGVCDHTPALPLTDTGLASQSGANTTIAVVATNASLNSAQLKRMATVSHDGLARSILPSHTLFDGDLVFALSTGTSTLVTPVEEAVIGHAASLCLSRAVARGVYEAQVSAGDILPSWQSKFGSG